jgi:NADH-quinone oxidoreductase subunit H
MNFFILSLIKAAVVAFVLLTTLAYLQWAERKVLAHIQLRVGPRRVGPHGLLQPLADVVKLITKEDMLPSHVNKFFYFLAPFIAVLFALIPIAVIPFGTEINIGPIHTAMQLTDLNIGVLFILGISGLGVYGVALAGWASNNKYSLLGGLRSSAQMISYELPMTMAIAAPLLLLNTLSFRELVNAQAGYYFGFIPRWSIFQAPFPFLIISFLLFLVAAFAETNRIPFDLPEAENELVAGFHTEYASMKFAAFFSHAMNPARPFDRLTLPVFGIVFLGAAAIFLVPIVAAVLLPLFWFSAKLGFILFLYIWVRGTLPRFRYDQLMSFAWTFMFPVALINLFIVGLWVALT